MPWSYITPKNPCGTERWAERRRHGDQQRGKRRGDCDQRPHVRT